LARGSPAITHVDDGFDLLGFRIVRRPWRENKRVAITFPSQRAFREVMHRIKTLTTRSTRNRSLDQLIHVLNPILRGWTNYHRHATSSRAFAYLSHYLWWRVIRWLRKKYERLTWKQIRRRCLGTAGPAEKARVSPGPTRYTTRPKAAVA
jgi:RNA-directed DNA polymerase